MHKQVYSSFDSLASASAHLATRGFGRRRGFGRVRLANPPTAGVGSPEPTPATTAGASSTDGGSAGGGSEAELLAFDDLGLGTSARARNFEDVLVE